MRARVNKLQKITSAHAARNRRVGILGLIVFLYFSASSDIIPLRGRFINESERRRR